MATTPQKILIADDDASIRLVLSQAFSRLGYDVRATGNAATLLKWVTDGDGDLVITDVVVPGLDGGTLVARLRVHEPPAPALGSLGHAGVSIGNSGSPFVGAELFAKPFSAADLLHRVRQSLQGRR